MNFNLDFMDDDCDIEGYPMPLYEYVCPNCGNTGCHTVHFTGRKCSKCGAEFHLLETGEEVIMQVTKEEHSKHNELINLSIDLLIEEADFLSDFWVKFAENLEDLR